MIAFVAAVSPTASVLGAAAAYVGVGAAVGVALRRRGVEPATAWSALAVWPLLLPVLAPVAPAASDGPVGARITATFAALDRAVSLPHGADPSWDADLRALHAALRAADERLRLVDRLLAETPAAPDDETAAEAAALRGARDAAATEILEVLTALERLRLQLGRMVLAGDGAQVGDHLRQLRARVTASTEVARLARG